MRKVAIIGVGMNKWGELWYTSLRELHTQAALAALDDAAPSSLPAYQVLSTLLIDLSQQQGLPVERADALRTLLKENPNS